MKHNVFTCILFCLALSGMAQFVPQPLNYPGPGYWPYYFSIVDPQHVWIGTIYEGGPYSSSVRTTNGGSSWIFNPIPVSGSPFCTSVSACNANTCFFVFSDENNGGGSVWKTTDSGNNWSQTTTTQFAGGFADFCHAFSTDTVMAVGDPTSGYFEICFTFNGGTTWTRTPSANIPLPLTDEWAFPNSYSSIGNSVWFATNRGRCFRSADKGQHWDVSQVFTSTDNAFDVCFSDALHGVFWQKDAFDGEIAISNDGGINWSPITFPPGYSIANMSRVPGFGQGFVLTAWKNYMDVYFTPNLFSTLIKFGNGILSTGAISFYDASTGWLAGGESGTNEIFKFTGLLTPVKEALEAGMLSIAPNPSRIESLVTLPGNLSSHPSELRIVDMTGKEVDRFAINSTSGWLKLNASEYRNGIYIVEVLSDNNIIAREKWVVSH